MLYKFRVLDVRNTNYEGIFFDGMWLQSSKHDLGLGKEEEVEEEKPVPGMRSRESRFSIGFVLRRWSERD